jgi:hypothetical protein
VAVKHILSDLKRHAMTAKHRKLMKVTAANQISLEETGNKYNRGIYRKEWEQDQDCR